MAVVRWVTGLLFSSQQIYVPRALAIDSALAAECWGDKGSFKLACLRKHRKEKQFHRLTGLCAAVCFGTVHHLNPQGKDTVHIFFTQSREAPVETAVITFTALLVVFRFPAIFYCCRNWPQSTEGSCTRLYWNRFVHLLSSPPLACQVTPTVSRELCSEGEMQFLCGDDPSSWPSGCQHRPAERQRGAGMGRGWWAARTVAPSRARVISSCSRNPELVFCVFLMYSLGQHHKGMSQEFVYGTSQRGFLLGL